MSANDTGFCTATAPANRMRAAMSSLNERACDCNNVSALHSPTAPASSLGRSARSAMTPMGSIAMA
eukprot:201937-Chlamydomonas_euryale.AAC.1